MTELRIFVVDDHPVMRQGIELLLSKTGMNVVGAVATAAEARAGVARLAPDIVLVDLCLGQEKGLSLMHDLAHLPGAPKLLVYSMNEDAASVEESLAAGAQGYVTKSELWETLFEALQAVATGKPYLSPRASRSLLVPSRKQVPARLSAREREVFRMLGKGDSISDISIKLDVSPRTVESYCNRLLVKLSLTGMRALRRYAIAQSGKVDSVQNGSPRADRP
jgi:two-component system, NarL family, invasion response regulator UvrY